MTPIQILCVLVFVLLVIVLAIRFPELLKGFAGPLQFIVGGVYLTIVPLLMFVPVIYMASVVLVFPTLKVWSDLPKPTELPELIKGHKYGELAVGLSVGITLILFGGINRLIGQLGKNKRSSPYIRGRKFSTHAEIWDKLYGGSLSPWGVYIIQPLAFVCTVVFRPWRVLAHAWKVINSSINTTSNKTSKTQQKTDTDPPKPPTQFSKVFWGMMAYPLGIAQRHFLVMGATSSGKTLIQRLLMQSVLPFIGTGQGIRALVFDPKRDMLPIIAGILPDRTNVRIYILNAFDERSVPWDMAADIQSPEHANALAAIFCPPEDNATNRFFPDAARLLFSAVLNALIIQCPGKWTLRDVVLSMKSVERLRAVLYTQPSTAALFEMFMKNIQKENREASSILSTVATKILPYELVAAMWERADWNNKFSIRKWMQEEAILVLAANPTRKDSMNPLNQALFQRLAHMVTGAPETDGPKTWIFMDELRELGKFDALPSMLNEGRSKGVAVAVGFQTFEGLDKVYGWEVASEIMGSCLNKTFLQNDAIGSTWYVERYFGPTEYYETTYSGSTSQNVDGNSSTSSNWQTQKQQMPSFMATELQSFRLLSTNGVLEGIHNVPGYGSYKTATTAAELNTLLRPIDANEAMYETKEGSRPIPKRGGLHPEIERPISHQYLSDWTTEDLKRIGLPLNLLDPAEPKKTSKKTGNPLLKDKKQKPTDS